MNFIRNRILTEETYIKVIAAFTCIGTTVGMYDGLKHVESSRDFKNPLSKQIITEKIIYIACDGLCGGATGLIAGLTIPVWLPVTTVATGLYATNLIYKNIF